MDYVASAVMHKEIKSVTPLTTCVQLEAAFLEHNVSGVPVVDGEELVGVVSRTDLLARNTEVNESAFVRDIMTTEVVTVDPQDHLHVVADLMYDQKIHRIFVVRSGELEGVITPFDFVRLYSTNRIGADGRPVNTQDV